MRMAEDKFITKRIAYIRNIKAVFLLSHEGIKTNMKEHITELLLHILIIFLQDSLREFVDLLYRIGSDTLFSLLPIPRALRP